MIRAGAGMFYDRLQGNPVFDMLPNPPSTAIPQFYYGSLATIPSAASGAFFPQSVNGFDKAGQIPTTYNWNFTIQRELPWAILFDVGYVGSSVQPPAVPLQPERDPARRRLAAAEPGSAQSPIRSSTAPPASQPNFYRPYSGYRQHDRLRFRRQLRTTTPCRSRPTGALSKDLTFGVAYTWSKAMGTTNDDYTANVPFNTARRPTTTCSAPTVRTCL